MVDIVCMKIIIDEFLNDSDDDDHFEDDNVIFLSTASLLKREKALKFENFVEDILKSYHDYDFKKNFRLNKCTFDLILLKISNRLECKTPSGKEALIPSKQHLVFVWYMSNQCSMREIGNLFGVSSSTVHYYVKTVAHIICQFRQKLILWPNAHEQQNIAAAFAEQCGIENIIGAIDGTHVRLYSAPNADKDYYNRKGFSSLQLQLVVDNKLLIRDTYVGWPESTHDARVLRNSDLFDKAETESLTTGDSFLIGDTAYPLKNWLLTPFKDNGHLNASQRYYNKSISSARQCVERAIGLMKCRFRRLKNIYCLNCQIICELVTSACILHNICVLENDEIASLLNEDMHDNNPNNFPGIYPDAVDAKKKPNCFKFTK